MAAKKKTSSPSAELERMIDCFEPNVAKLARACLDYVRKLTPGAMERVYDAYNALSIGFSTGDRLKDTFVHVAIYPKHVNIGFNRGVDLEDPSGILQGTGSTIRHVSIKHADDLKDPALAKLVKAAAWLFALPKAPKGRRGEVVIAAIYDRKRPRRPIG